MDLFVHLFYFWRQASRIMKMRREMSVNYGWGAILIQSVTLHVLIRLDNRTFRLWFPVQLGAITYGSLNCLTVQKNLRLHDNFIWKYRISHWCWVGDRTYQMISELSNQLPPTPVIDLTWIQYYKKHKHS